MAMERRIFSTNAMMSSLPQFMVIQWMHSRTFWVLRMKQGATREWVQQEIIHCLLGRPYSVWKDALEDALKNIKAFGAEALIISLGVDTFENDPISFFKLKSDDFTHYGSLLAKAELPTHFVMEGGYGVKEIGLNVANVLSGFENG